MIENDETPVTGDADAVTGTDRSATPGRVSLRRITIDDQDEFIALVPASVDLHHP